MKSKKTYIATTILLTCLTGCSSSKGTDKKEVTPFIPVSELTVNQEIAAEVFEDYGNLKSAENIYINVPEKPAGIYTYTAVAPSDVDMKKYDSDFRGMFGYLFPGHEINDEYLFHGDDKVCDIYDKIISGEEGRVNYTYKEPWPPTSEEDSPVYFSIANPVGYGYACINKGKTLELIDGKDYMGEECSLLGFEPEDDLVYVGTYPRDSMESFMLADKEVVIKDAVEFYEHYINGLPYPEEKNTRTSVIDVEVYKVTDDIYGYNFNTTREYEGVIFDYMKSGTIHSQFDEYAPCLGTTFMVESNDIDVLYGYYQMYLIEDLETYENMVSFESATEIISDKMTDGVEFEVRKIELVYLRKPATTEEGYVDIENPSSEITPAWKFTLYNPNDTYLYVCYVNAIDGVKYDYYKTPTIEE